MITDWIEFEIALGDFLMRYGYELKDFSSAQTLYPYYDSRGKLDPTRRGMVIQPREPQHV